MHRVFLMISISVLLFSCRSMPKKSVINSFSQEKIQTFSKKLTANLQQVYGAWDDIEIKQILKNLITKLLEADAIYKISTGEIHIELLKTDTPYIIPGFSGTIYISKGLLKIPQYENELMFLLAVQLSMLKNGIIEKRYSRLVLDTSRDYLSSGWFEPNGLFDFGMEPYLNADRAGIQLEYAARYDPRGATTFLTRLLELHSQIADHPRIPFRKMLPELSDRLDTAREEVAKLLPLRDPIIKSRAFEDLEARINQ